MGRGFHGFHKYPVLYYNPLELASISPEYAYLNGNLGGGSIEGVLGEENKSDCRQTLKSFRLPVLRGYGSGGLGQRPPCAEDSIDSKCKCSSDERKHIPDIRYILSTSAWLSVEAEASCKYSGPPSKSSSCSRNTEAKLNAPNDHLTYMTYKVQPRYSNSPRMRL